MNPGPSTGPDRVPATPPRLLYAADVPVEASGGGALLGYRLLLGYPAESLRVLETNLFVSDPARRLPGVDYGVFPMAWARLLRTRLAPVYSAWLVLSAPRRARLILQRLGGFRPDALLTVAHGYGWLAAAAAAARLRVPLHLIVHDDWPTFVPAPAWLRPWIARRFGRVYRQAVSRLCVSPAMAEEYARRFGVPGTVLLPSRGPGTDPERSAPAPPARPFTLGYAGAVSSESYESALGQAAESLAALGGRLLVYSPSGLQPGFRAEIARRSLPLEWRQALPSEELIRTLRAEADALLVPMSFSPSEDGNTRLSFPSKLTDYTRVGLPLLIYGPEKCSAVRWARENPSAARTVTDADGPALAAALAQFARDPVERARLAQGALDAGARHFSHARAQCIFLEALGNPPQNPARPVDRPPSTP